VNITNLNLTLRM